MPENLACVFPLMQLFAELDGLLCLSPGLNVFDAHGEREHRIWVNPLQNAFEGAFLKLFFIQVIRPLVKIGTGFHECRELLDGKVVRSNGKRNIGAV